MVRIERAQIARFSIGRLFGAEMTCRTYISGSSVSWTCHLSLSETKVARCTLFVSIVSCHGKQVAVKAGRAWNSLRRAFRAIKSQSTVLLGRVGACSRGTVISCRALNEGRHTVCVVLIRALANVSCRTLDAIGDGLAVLVCGVVARGTASFQIDA